MIRGTTEVIGDGMTHGTTADGTADGMIRGITADGTTHGTMVDITVDGTEDTTDIMDGTHTGDITITTTTLQCRSTTRSAGMETADRPALTECSPAECPQEEAWQAPAG